MDNLLAILTVSVTELKGHYLDTLNQTNDEPEAALNHSTGSLFAAHRALRAFAEQSRKEVEDGKRIRERAEETVADVQRTVL